MDAERCSLTEIRKKARVKTVRCAGRFGVIIAAKANGLKKNAAGFPAAMIAESEA